MPKETGESSSAFRKAATCEFIFIYPGIMYTVLMPRLNGDQSDSDTAKEQVNSTVGTDEEHITYIVSRTWINVGMKTVGERLHHFYFHIFFYRKRKQHDIFENENGAGSERPGG